MPISSKVNVVRRRVLEVSLVMPCVAVLPPFLGTVVSRQTRQAGMQPSQSCKGVLGRALAGHIAGDRHTALPLALWVDCLQLGPGSVADSRLDNAHGRSP